MTTTQVSAREFKAKCLQILREVAKGKKQIQITDGGKVVAVVTPPVLLSMNDFAGSLRGTVTYHAGWDAPLGPEDWEACR